MRHRDLQPTPHSSTTRLGDSTRRLDSTLSATAVLVDLLLHVEKLATLPASQRTTRTEAKIAYTYMQHVGPAHPPNAPPDRNYSGNKRCSRGNPGRNLCQNSCRAGRPRETHSSSSRLDCALLWHLPTQQGLAKPEGLGCVLGNYSRGGIHVLVAGKCAHRSYPSWYFSAQLHVYGAVQVGGGISYSASIKNIPCHARGRWQSQAICVFVFLWRSCRGNNVSSLA